DPPRVRLSRRHAEIRPDFRQIALSDSQQIDSLAAGDLHHAGVVFFSGVRDLPQFRRRRHPAANAWDHGKRAVALNIGVNAIVNEARGPVFFVIAAPDHVYHVAERGLAHLAAVRVSVDIEYFLNRLQLLRPDHLPQILLRKRHAFAQHFFRLFLEARGHGLEDLLAYAGAASASGGRARAFFQLRKRVDAFV